MPLAQTHGWTSILSVRFCALLVCWLFAAHWSACGQQFSIVDARIGTDGRLVLKHAANTNSYYILLHGDQVTAILTARDMQLGSVGTNQLKDPNLATSAGFYRVRQVPLSSPLDTDADGIDDVYELRRRPLLEPLDATDASLDPDRDGMTTLEEYRSGRNPFVSDLPQVTTISYPTNATTASFVIFSGVATTNTLIRVEGGAAYVTNAVGAGGAFDVMVALNPNRLNRLFVSAADEYGNVSAPVPIDILQDSTPPFLFIDFPTNGTVLTTSNTLVAGRVGDALSGFLGLSVMVKGEPANVDVGIGPNGTFQRMPVSLSIGPNQITVVASDRLGNSSTKNVTIIREEPAGPRLLALSGDLQATNIMRRLAAPLVVRVTQAGGTPLANKLVNFQITRSDGRLLPVNTNQLAADIITRADYSSNGAMFLQLFTDASGEARAWWTMGRDAGHANNRVTVSSKDLADTVYFCASATALSAKQINIGSGNNQRGETLGHAPEPLKVWVSDGNNPVAGVPVTFRVAQGGGELVPIVAADGMSPGGPGLRGSRPTGSIALKRTRRKDALASEVTVLTSITGHGEVDFLFGPESGNQIVEATFTANAGLPATFNATALARVPGQPTSFTGLIQDNAMQPIGRAICELSIAGATLTAYSDTQGRFAFANIPAGTGHLYVNGGTAITLGTNSIPSNSFPALQYTIAVVPNAENSLPTPVLLPRLNTNNAKWYYGTNDLVVTCDGIAGLKMIIKGNSMKHPGGEIVSPGRPAFVSLNQVHHDDIPMPMPDGASPPFAWTLQPGGATFDPPVQVEYPNMSGLAPGAAAFFLTFNHDTERFEIVASGHVVEDGSQIVCDEGAGLTISGWGCNCPPYSVAGDCIGIPTPDPSNDTNSPPGHPEQEPPTPEPCPRSSGSRGQSCEDSPPCPQRTDPIYLFSGEMYLDAEDLRIKGRGMDFIWSRKYRSKLGLNTAMGNGWDFSYNLFLETSGINFYLCDGRTRKDLYELRADGTWARREFFRSLIANPDGSHTMVQADQQQWNFHPFDGSAAQGKIASIVDRNGNTLSFAYNVQGRLTNINDTLSRNIRVAYNADGFIESITDFAGRAVRYAYYQNGDPNGSFGDLKSAATPAVTGTPNGNDFPNGKTTGYTYSTGFADERLNHNLLTVTDGRRNNPNDPTFGRGPYVTNTYSATVNPNDFNFDRVVRQVWGGGAIDLVYVPLPQQTPANEFATTKVIMNERVGNVKELFYNQANRLVLEREYTGRANPAQPTTETQNRPTGKLRPSDPAFFETRYMWNQETLLRMVVHPRGNKTIYTYEYDLDTNALPRARGNLREIRRIPLTNDAVTPSINGQSIIVGQFQYDSQFGACCGFSYVTRHVDGRGNVTVHTYDAQGNRTRTQHRLPTIVEDFGYNQFGQMTAHVHPDNGSGHRRRDEFTYYTNGVQRGYLQREIIDAASLRLTSTSEYDPVGNRVRLIDPRGDDKRFVFNQLDQIVREISAEVLDGSGIRYTNDFFYDANNNLVRTEIQNRGDLESGGIIPVGNPTWTTTLEYEILNHLVRKSEEVEADRFVVTEHAYDANRNRTLTRYGEATAGRQPDNVVQMLHDERDLLFREIRAPSASDQSTTQFDYDANRNRIRIQQGLEDVPHVTHHLYDGFDRAARSTDAMGNVTSVSHDANGNRLRVLVQGEMVDVLGSGANVRLSETAFAYDAMNRLIRQDVDFFDANTQGIIGDGKATTQTFYNDNSQVVAVVNDNNHGITNRYDTANRLSVEIDAKGNRFTHIYDADNNVIVLLKAEKSDLDEHIESFTTTFGYDGLNRVTSITDNIGNVTKLGYDSRSNRTITIDALTNVVRHDYDGLNRLTRTTRPMTQDGTGTSPVTGQIVTRQTWDDTARLTSQIDDNGNATTYLYDALNRKAATVFADDTGQTNVFDVHHNAIRMTDANGNIVICAYDLLNRLMRKDVTVGPGVSADTTFEVFQHDGLSRMVSAQDDDSLVARAYDSLSRVIQELQNGQPVTCLYDGVGNQIQCVYPSGRTITTSYDALERKKTISDGSGLLARYDYIGPKRVAQRDYGNGTRVAYKYDGITGIPNPPRDFSVKDIVRTTHIRLSDNTIIDDRTYAWDRSGNKTQSKNVRAGGPQLTHDYRYDSAYRLVQSTRSAPTGLVEMVTYNLDGVGNRLSVIGGTNAGAYILDGTLPEPADRQLNQYTTAPFEARRNDRNGNLTSLNPGQAAHRSFSYDYVNQMVRHTDSAAGVTTRYSYDALGRRLQKTIADAQLKATRFVWQGWQEIEEMESRDAEPPNFVPTASYIFGKYIDEVLSFRVNGRDFYCQADRSFNIVAVTDSGGNVVQRYDYDDFGNASLFDLAPTTVDNPLLFTGRRFDPETRLYYYRTRFFYPSSGRFTTRDTIGIWGDPSNMGNGYAYVANNPATRVDPYGQDSPGCDAKSWVEWQFGKLTSCHLICCAQHDKCYHDNKCSSGSFWPTLNPFCGKEKNCDRCNDEAWKCLTVCKTLPDYKDDPKRDKYYCGEEDRPFNDPNDPCMNRECDYTKNPIVCRDKGK